MHIPVAYYDPKKPKTIETLNKLNKNVVKSSSIGKEHEVRKHL